MGAIALGPDGNLWFIETALPTQVGRMNLQAIGTPAATPTATTAAPASATATSTPINTATSTTGAGPSPTATGGATLVGDCSGKGSVAIGDLITLVNIALGNALASVCPHGIPNGKEVDISLLIQAVNNALRG